MTFMQLTLWFQVPFHSADPFPSDWMHRALSEDTRLQVHLDGTELWVEGPGA